MPHLSPGGGGTKAHEGRRRVGPLLRRGRGSVGTDVLLGGEGGGQV